MKAYKIAEFHSNGEHDEEGNYECEKTRVFLTMKRGMTFLVVLEEIEHGMPESSVWYDNVLVAAIRVQNLSFNKEMFPIETLPASCNDFDTEKVKFTKRESHDRGGFDEKVETFCMPSRFFMGRSRERLQQALSVVSKTIL